MTKPDQSALLSCMDYLHGDAVDNEFEAACYYEYARESCILCEASRLWARKKHSDKEWGEFLPKIENRFRGAGTWWSHIWRCPSFPRQSWNQLNPQERADILPWFRPSQIPPLSVNAVWPLNAPGLSDQLKTMAAKVRKSERLGRPQQQAYPIPWVRGIFTLGFWTTRKQLVREFDKWLQLRENKKRFDAYERDQTGKTGLFKDRLKDLAACRLHRQLAWEKALAFAEINRKRDENGRARQFHDARKEQSKKQMPLNKAPLYSEESGFFRARSRARDHMARLFPWEFGKSAGNVEKSLNELAMVFHGAPKMQARKISRSSF